jgi:hypothetical protein
MEPGDRGELHHMPDYFSLSEHNGYYIRPLLLTVTAHSVLPTVYVYVFCVDLRTNSDYFPIQY